MNDDQNGPKIPLAQLEEQTDSMGLLNQYSPGFLNTPLHTIRPKRSRTNLADATTAEAPAVPALP